MTIEAEHLRDTCQLLVIELTRLQQLNRKLTIDDFFDLSEREVFVRTLIDKYGWYMRSIKHLIDEESSHQKEMLSYVENAFSRHSNVVTEDTFGVVDDAFLLAINVTIAIMREADQMR